MVALTGNPDGTSEVDYTVNPATGLPVGDRPAQPRRAAQQRAARLGRRDGHARRRPGCSPPSATARRTGEGTLVRLSLSDVAFAMVGNLGRIAEAQLGRARPAEGRQLPLRRVRPRLRDARRAPRDGRRADAAPMERAAGGDRHRRRVREHRAGDRPRPRAPRRAASSARDLIAALLRPWFAARDLAEIRDAFAGTGVSWGPYQTFRQLVTEDPRARPRTRCSARSSTRASAPT